MIAVYVVAVLVGMGILFGFFLGFANKKLSVETDPRIHEVDDVLPKGQCGACGFAGCMAYAEAVVKNPDVAPNLCSPGKEAVALEVARITGKNPAPMDEKIATVRCAGSYEKAVRTFDYQGPNDCISANLLQGGNKGCIFGCLGYGTCVKACQFGALKMTPEGLPVVNADRCTGCGKCAQICPRVVIQLYNKKIHVRVNCNSHDKGAVSRKHCSTSCIACGLCAKQCPYGAIVIDNNLAVVDHKICEEKCSDPVCLTKCPTKAITLAVYGAAPGEEDRLDAAAGIAVFETKQ